MNLNPFSMCECNADNSYYVNRTTWPKLTVQIISYNENIIEGRFEGNFKNRGGKEIPVTNGYFKIKLRSEEEPLTSQMVMNRN